MYLYAVDPALNTVLDMSQLEKWVLLFLIKLKKC